MGRLDGKSAIVTGAASGMGAAEARLFAREAARVMGWECADSVDEAIEMARSFLGRDPSLTHLHIPPINMVDVSV